MSLHRRARALKGTDECARQPAAFGSGRPSRWVERCVRWGSITAAVLSFLPVTTPSVASAQTALEMSQRRLVAGTDKLAGGLGQSVATNGETIAAGTASGVQLWIQDGLEWNPSALLTAEPAAKENSFGQAVAIDREAVVIGAPLDDDKGEDAGAVYFSGLGAGRAGRLIKLSAPDAKAGDHFGEAAAVSGPFSVVGAPLRDEQGRDAGAAYIFRKGGAGWSSPAKIKAPDDDDDDRFGVAVAIDGDIVVIGAPNDDEKGLDAGAAYVFQRKGNEWVLTAKLTSEGAAPGDGFGGSVTISGHTIAVGAQEHGDGGAVFVFELEEEQWQASAKLVAADADVGDAFGSVIALAGDTLVVGAPLDDDKGSRSGSVYVFRRTPAWVPAAKVTASDGKSGDAFGAAIALSGNLAIAGSPLAASASGAMGAIYLLVLQGGAEAPPQPTATFEPSASPSPTAKLTATKTQPRAVSTATSVPTPSRTKASAPPATPTRPVPPTVAQQAAAPARPCGNGVLDPGEQCDPGTEGPGGCCSADCRAVGNGQSCNDKNPATDNDVCLAGRCGSDVVPLVRVEARYPERALAAGVEGSVRLEFTVTAQGTVEDIKVLSAEPPRYFESAAKTALAQYKYQPRLENGVPVKRPGAQVVISFKVR
jgi:TonB family protein